MASSSNQLGKTPIGNHSLEFYNIKGKVVAHLYTQTSKPKTCILEGLETTHRYSYETLTGKAKETIDTFLRSHDISLKTWNLSPIKEKKRSSLFFGKKLAEIRIGREKNSVKYKQLDHLIELIERSDGKNKEELLKGANQLYMNLLNQEEIPQKEQGLEKISKKYQTIVDQLTTSPPEVGELLKLQDELQQVPANHRSSFYTTLSEQIEALTIVALTDQATLPEKQTTFSLGEKDYQVVPTRGEGACALHALLGTESGGIYRFPGESTTSSSRAKTSFTNHFKEALKKRDPHTIALFIGLIQSHLTSTDPSSQMLFNDSQPGKALVEEAKRLSVPYITEREKIKKEEALLWLQEIEQSQDILSHLFSEVEKITDPTSFYYRKSEEELALIFKKEPLRLLSRINEERPLYLSILRNDAKKAIETLQLAKEDLLRKESAQKKGWILSEKMVDHYIETVNHPPFYLNTQEIELAAHLFQKKVLIVKSEGGNIVPATSPINNQLSTPPIIIHHQGAHFSRCLPTNILFSSDQKLSPIFQTLTQERSSTPPLNRSTPPIPVLPKKPEKEKLEPPPCPLNLALLKQTEERVAKNEREQSLKDFRLLLFQVNNGTTSQAFDRLYALSLFFLSYLPKGLFEQLLGAQKMIPRLLKYTPSKGKEQLALATLCGQRYREWAAPLKGDAKINESILAMEYYSNAIGLATQYAPEKLKALHKEASKLFIPIIKEKLVDTQLYKERLAQCEQNAHPEDFEKILNEIQRLRAFQCDGGDYLLKLYQQAQEVLIKVRDNRADSFSHLAHPIGAGLTPTPLPQNPTYITERYRTALDEYRKTFPTQNGSSIRNLQKKQTEDFITFLNTHILKDTFAILGPPPPGYALMAMGSIAREEVRPYSDLEWMILIKEKSHFDYFQTLDRLINLQLTSLGEPRIGTKNPFTALQCPSGLHLDHGSHSTDYIRKPKEMANQTGLKTEEDPASLSHTLLRTRYLDTDSPELISKYKKKVQKILDTPAGSKTVRQWRALLLIKERITDYKKVWKQEVTETVISKQIQELGICQSQRPRFSSLEGDAGASKNQFSNLSGSNLKEQYIKPLFLLIGDLALYFGIDKTNTLDILDGFKNRKIFDPLTRSLLRESVEMLYTIHVDLQPLKDHETLLSRTYFLLLEPLYTYLEKVLEGALQKSNKSDPKEVKKTQLAPLEKSLINLSLPQLTFNQILSLASNPLEATAPLETFVTCMAQKVSEEKRHLYWYKKLSQFTTSEPLRSLYLKTLLQQKKTDLYNLLAPIPNREGTRQSVLIEEQAFYKSLTRLTQKTKSAATITSPTLGTRYIKETLFDDLFDSSDNISDDYPGEETTEGYRSAHNVCHLKKEELDLHIKQKPYHPLMEYAIYNLTSRLSGEGPPPTELAKITKGNNTYPVLISKTVPGINLQKALTKKTLPLDGKHHTWNLLLSILTRPADGRAPNYIYNRGKITSIDNDIAFAIPILKGEKSSEAWKRKLDFMLGRLPEKDVGKPMPHDTVRFCSILFTINPGFKLKQDVIKDFCNLKPNLILEGWIKNLEAKEKEYCALFNEKTLEKLFKENALRTFTPTLLFRKGEMATLCAQFDYLQRFLKSSLNVKRKVTANRLLDSLINLRAKDYSTQNIGKYLSNAYKNRGKTAENRLEKAVGRTVRQSSTSIGAQYSCYGKELTYKEIKKGLLSISKAKEEFLLYSTFKTARAIKEGIEVDFINLVGDDERERILTSSLKLNLLKNYSSLHIQGCTTLNTPTLLPFLHRNIKILDLSGSGIVFFKEIGDKTPSIEELNLSCCLNLLSLEIPGKEATAFKPETPPSQINLPNLKKLNLSYCHQLATIRLNAPKLETLSLRNSAISNFSGFGNTLPHLRKLNLSFCSKLRSIEIPGLATSLPVRLPKLKSLNVSQCRQLTTIRLKASSLYSFKNTYTPALKNIHIDLKNYDYARLNHSLLKAQGLKRSIAQNKKDIARLLSNQDLQTLDLSFCVINNKWAEIIAQLITKSKALKEVKLRYSKLSEKAIAGLLDATKNSSTLINLDLTGNKVPIELDQAIYECLRKNQVSLHRHTAPQLPKIAFGPEEWEKYIGYVDKTVPLPSNIESILNSDCPIWRGKKTKDTHLLTFIPQKINGKPLTINSFQDLIESKNLDDKAAAYRYYYVKLKEDLGNQKVPYPYWIMMSYDVIPNSRGKDYTAQEAMVKMLSKKTEQPYDLPKTLEATIVALTNYIRSKTMLYADKPRTYTRCQEMLSDEYGAKVGGFSSGGLGLGINFWEPDSIGVGVVRKFSQGSG
ncbi:DUF294 nucleotidyltransferase-like domain-containing protein [Candidatus Neptunochlamydia vexilliferae]|uniref:Protein-PII uridylyltransferase N-terminal domain-containing protein n=1 Tax=Candidatus Neptunichlamydia vexilliferae TaxID=1651774 RepID=A0ABS0B0P6_9BACT|nr:DUF294 nucleotidyltransferase-like domain-containing protein [Candidatus Neptunochlamydia vexilliferae]MBF5059960.1 hypothetical protein [Candidatus Neptunochlamydia vexilliferae]